MCNNSWVLPMFPGVKNWRLNGILLRIFLFFIRPDVIISRGVFAANLSINLRFLFHRHKTVFDARGAYHAEFTEYNLSDNRKLISEISELEKNAIQKSEYRLAVSNALVNYWLNHYQLDFRATTKVIPCTLNSEMASGRPDYSERARIRTEAGFQSDDIVFIYSGSTAGWQSLPRLYEWLATGLRENTKIKLLLLTEQTALTGTPLAEFSNRVVTKWMKPSEVHKILLCGDYGLLIREKSITNQVSSPTKFAEYLFSGMKVIISEGIGDFSSFVVEQTCGLLSNSVKFGELKHLNEYEFNHSVKTAVTYFTKEKFMNDYIFLTQPVNGK